MLDGKTDPTTLPDEFSGMRQRMESLFDKITKLDEVLRRNIEELRIGKTPIRGKPQTVVLDCGQEAHEQ